ncbi:MAG: cold shock domain-containing protein [Proteobacteria bacterium]|nr:cold shock domain-containing protein [Pseudomonadota bacterium]
MPSGSVKWFNNAKGYGFIIPEDGGVDLFAHFSAVSMDGYKTLSAGDQVDFEVTVGDKGPQATNIVVTSAAQSAPDAVAHAADASPQGADEEVSAE